MHACALARATPRSIAPGGSFSPSMEVDSEGTIATYEHEVWALVAPTFRIILVLPIGKPNHRTAPHRTRPRKGEPPEGWLQLAQLVAHYCTYCTVFVSQGSMYRKLYRSPECTVSAARSGPTSPHHMAVGGTVGRPLAVGPPCSGTRGFAPGDGSLRRKAPTPFLSLPDGV